MKNIWLTIVFIFNLNALSAQKTHWAHEVVSVSSEYQDDYYAAKQALGVPNGFYNPSLDYLAWTPAKESANTGEYLHVSFKKARHIQQIAIYQMGNVGAVSKIWLYDLEGKKHKVYENENPSKNEKAIFRKKIAKTTYKVKELKVEVSTKDVPGVNQIDAIGISESATEINLNPNTLSYNISDIGQAEKLSPSINSNYSERMPLISPDGRTLYFARKKHPQNIGTSDKDDIWVSYLNRDETWSKALNIGTPLNNENHNFVLAIDPSGKKLFLANDYKGNKKDAISVSHLEGRSWQEPKRLEIEDHYNKSKFVNYHLSNDGNILLMAVERDEGFGDRDIYVSFKTQSKKWTKPRNIGSKINTVSSENSVFLASDNKTIYFSSNGHLGYGGFDIFVSERLDNSWQKWSEPKNLGKPINSMSNDLSFSIPASGDYAYYSAGSITNSDLYRIKLPEEAKPDPVTLLSTKFIDADTGKPIKAEVVFEGLNARKNKASTKDQGRDSKYIVPQGEDISYYAEAEGYFPVSDHVNNSYSEIEELDYDNDAYSTNEELRKLQSKLERVQGDIQKLNRERKKTNILLKKQESSKRNKNQYEEVFQNVDPQKEKSENEELLSLMDKYNLHYGKKPDPKSNTHTNSKKQGQSKPISSLKKKPARSGETTKPKENDSLAEVRNKYNKHYNKDLQERKTEEETPNETSPTTIESSEEVESSETEYTVENIKKVREELIKELVPELKMDLYEEYYDEIKKEVRKEMEMELKNDEMEVVEEKVKEQIIENWEEEVEEVSLSADEKEAIQTDLWFQMQDKLKEELKEEISEDIKEELERETIIAIKEKEEELIQQKIEKQITSGPKQTLQKEETVSIDEAPVFEEVERSLKLVPLKVGAVIPMNNIFFDANQASLKSASFAELDRIIDFLFKNENIVVEIGGHTNGWCSHEFASELSRDRAEEVSNYIIENGINEARVHHKGYGKTKPIASNDTLQGRKQNQRVELKILEIID